MGAYFEPDSKKDPLNSSKQSNVSGGGGEGVCVGGHTYQPQHLVANTRERLTWTVELGPRSDHAT